MHLTVLWRRCAAVAVVVVAVAAACSDDGAPAPVAPHPARAVAYADGLVDGDNVPEVCALWRCIPLQASERAAVLGAITHLLARNAGDAECTRAIRATYHALADNKVFLGTVRRFKPDGTEIYASAAFRHGSIYFGPSAVASPTLMMRSIVHEGTHTARGPGDDGGDEDLAYRNTDACRY